jgi:hypothetical protein
VESVSGEVVGELVRGFLRFSLVRCCCEKLASEARDSSGTQSKLNVRR